MPLDLESRVSCDPETGCWLWAGYLKDGYGSIHNGRKREGAHRRIYKDFVGPIPNGMEIDHLCFVPRCVNPAHLEAVTREENQWRAIEHRRRSGNPRPPLADRNARKTHCKRGHPLSGDNLRLIPSGRQCKACKLMLDRRRNRKKVKVTQA